MEICVLYSRLKEVILSGMVYGKSNEVKSYIYVVRNSRL